MRIKFLLLSEKTETEIWNLKTEIWKYWEHENG